MSNPPYPQDPNRKPEKAPPPPPYYPSWPPYGQDQSTQPASSTPYETQIPPPPPGAYNPYTQPSYPPPVAPPRPSRRRSLLLALAVLVILAAIGLVWFIPYQTRLKEQANATATASTQAAQVAATASSKNATATATTLAPTATARALAAATASVVAANPDPYPPAGTLTLFDPLQSLTPLLPNSGSCQFSDNAFHITVQQQAYTCFSGSTFTNFAFEVQMKIIQGDCGALLFRSDDAYNKYYGFEVCQKGDYYIFNYPGSNYKILQSSSSSIFQAGLNQTNTLAIVANGQHLDFYINKQRVASVTDSSYNAGHIGLYAEAVNAPTNVAFTNLKIWTI